VEKELLSFLEKAVSDIRIGDVLILTTDGMDIIFQSDYLLRLKAEDPGTLFKFLKS
jgi:hypothetical protein